jgi:hypothetical protein
MKCRQLIMFATLILSATFLFPDPALSYIGPGAGLSAIGAFVAIVVGIIAALFGFLWYPIKRLLRKLKKSSHDIQGGRAE